MTKYFEVVRRDGPARMGKLLLERSISTPGFHSKRRLRHCRQHLWLCLR